MTFVWIWWFSRSMYEWISCIARSTCGEVFNDDISVIFIFDRRKSKSILAWRWFSMVDFTIFNKYIFPLLSSQKHLDIRCSIFGVNSTIEIAIQRSLCRSQVRKKEERWTEGVQIRRISEIIPALTSPGWTRSASSVKETGQSRKIGYWNNHPRNNNIGNSNRTTIKDNRNTKIEDYKRHLHRQHVECSNAMGNWKARTVKERNEEI